MLTAALTFIGTVRLTTGQNPFIVLASSGNNWVYSVNNSSPDNNGNVDVAVVNGRSVNSNIPADADFAQYAQATTDISTIDEKLTGLTATADQVANGLTFVGSGGTLQTGTLNNEIDDVVSGCVSDVGPVIGIFLFTKQIAGNAVVKKR